MPVFWEFFTFELRFRLKSVSTYVYFGLWLLFSFLCVASQNFGPVGFSGGKVLLNSGYVNSYNDVGASLYGTIIIAAVFGTSILRNPTRYLPAHLHQAHLEVCLPWRSLGRILRHHRFCFSGMMFGTWLGTHAPWADQARIGPNHLWNYLEPFLSILVIQIFFLGSLYFTVAALTRKIFVVYLQGVAVFMFYLAAQTIFDKTRSLEHFWSGVLDAVGSHLFILLTKYWTVQQKDTLGISPGIPRASSCSIAFSGLASASSHSSSPGLFSPCRWKPWPPCRRGARRPVRASRIRQTHARAAPSSLPHFLRSTGFLAFRPALPSTAP